MMMLPLVISVIHILLLLLIFRIDTPVYYHSKGDQQKTREALTYMFKDYAIERQYNNIAMGDASKEGEDQEEA